MTRARLYVLVDAFERDVRSALEKFVTSEIGEEACLGIFFSSCVTKRENDSGSDTMPLVTFLDMRDGYDLLNVHRALLPTEFATEVRELTQNLDQLVSIRNRVMHARPLAAGDSDTAVSLLNQFQSRGWNELRRTLTHLQEEPAWEPVMTGVADDSKVLHNLPLPDYDETGLIGRGREARELVSLLKRGREPVVTVTGEGGIGKTALAIDVAYQLVDDPESPFEAVLWSSLKYEKLTAFGVREISGAARDLIGALQPVGAVLEGSFVGNVEELAELLDGFKILLVLDNMETISGDEFRTLYNTLPDSISYLVTSRIGVGEYERRYALESLSDKDSLQLFNQFVRSRRIQGLSRLTSETRVKVVQQLRYSPLAIKWFALAVEAGKDPLDLIRRQDELLEFCVRSVYDDLSGAAKEVLDALAVLARPVSSDELVVLLNRPIHEITTGVQELLRGSLVRRESGVGSDGLLFQIVLTETATQFLRRRVELNAITKDRLVNRERELRQEQERRAQDIADRSLAPVVVRQREISDAPTCAVLRQALLMAKRGDEQELVYEKLDLARRMNPDFWEVDRVEGFIRDSYGDLAAATASYEDAYAKAEGDDRAVVAYYFAGHLARKVRDISRAIDYAKEAHAAIGTHETGMALGNYLIWSHRFDEGIELLEKAVPLSTGKAQLIAVSALAEGWRRFAEHAGEKGRNFLDQYNYAWKGFTISNAAIDAGVADERLRTTAADCAAIAAQAAAICVRSSIRIHALPKDLAVLEDSVVRLNGTPSWNRFVQAIEKLARSGGAPVAVQRIRGKIATFNESESSSSPISDAPENYLGEVVSVQEKYGFIRHPSFPKNVFFHAGDIEAPHEMKHIHQGAPVRFSAVESERGPRATYVVLAFMEE